MPTSAKANDRYRAKTRATYIASPPDSSIQVTAIPVNLPTMVTIGWNTTYETLFRVESTSGTNASNYALTGLTKIKGFDGNLPEGLDVNCLNNEEFFNQFIDIINGIIATAGTAVGTTDTQTLTNKRITKRVISITSSATPTPTGDTADVYKINALAVNAAIQAPTGAPTDGQTLIIKIKDDGSVRALSWNEIYRAIGVVLPTATVASKIVYVGLIWNENDDKWDAIAVQQEV